MEWSLGGPLSELYPMTPPTNQNKIATCSHLSPTAAEKCECNVLH